jgi:RNA polymerase sigma factor (sigma-70 family)
MDQGESRQHLIELLDELIWQQPAERLGEQERSLAAQLASAGLGWIEALSRLCDESLALAIQKGFRWKEAFEELFVTRYLARLGRWFHGMRASPEQAQELTQQVLCKFLGNRLRSFAPTGTFRTYLQRAAENLWVDALRRRRGVTSLERVPEPPDGAVTAEQDLLGKELAARLEQALGSLPDLDQGVLRRTIDGERPAEIALALGLPKPRVFNLLFHARRKLEKLLKLPPRPRRLPAEPDLKP